eukprot:gene11676-15633_t
MYKSQQEALYQATNQGIIAIRQAELSYYVGLNSALGTQAALIGGFTYSIFTQNTPNAKYEYPNVMIDIYWVLSVIAIASSVHVIITTMLLQVMGPGLALNGPLGSMVKATEAMRSEQDHVIIAFAIMIFGFASSTMIVFWVVMDYIPAAASSVLFMFAARCWYFYSRRIFLKLDYDKTSISWHDQSDDRDPFRRSSMGPTIDVDLSKLQQTTNNHNNNSNINVNEQSTNRSSTLLNKFFKSKTNDNQDLSSHSVNQIQLNSMEVNSPIITQSSSHSPTSNHSVKSILSASNGNSQLNTSVAMEGYLTKRNRQNSSSRVNWDRRYFILNNYGYIYYYKSRQYFRENPSNPIKERPIDLKDFIVSIANNDTIIDDSTNTIDTDSVTGSEVAESVGGTMITSVTNRTMIQSIFSNKTSVVIPTFMMILSPSDEANRTWYLKCDTEEELTLWLDTMKQISPDSFKNN